MALRDADLSQFTDLSQRGKRRFGHIGELHQGGPYVKINILIGYELGNRNEFIPEKKIAYNGQRLHILDIIHDLCSEEHLPGIEFFIYDFYDRKSNFSIIVGK